VNAFLVVVIVVAIVGIAIGLTARFRPTRAMEQIGRRGSGSLGGGQSDTEAREADDRPYADEPEERVPARPLRSRQD
jgi:hypothetical protein